MENNYQIFVGLGNTHLKIFFLKRRITSTISKICKKYNVGFSVFRAVGGYATQSDYIIERSLVVYITDSSEDVVRLIAKDLRKTLKQESVVFRKVFAQSEFV